ncbi:MAG: hypothetical protein WCP97_05655 [bacterium]
MKKNNKKYAGTAVVVLVVFVVLFLYSCQFVSSVKETSRGGEDPISQASPTVDE